jgi:probable phosphoglycerate mutase
VTTTVFLVRHGSHDRLGRILCGRMNGVSLSERGREEARAAARRLAAEELAAVYSSPLERTQETAELVAEAAGLPVEIAPDLTEIDFGAWTGSEFAALADDPGWMRWNATRTRARAPGGETLPEVQTRLVRWLDEACRRHPAERIAAVSHGDPIKTLLAHAIGLPLGNLDRLEISPASVSVLLAGDWGMRVASVNEVPR